MEKGIPIKSSAQEQKHARALAILKETMLQISKCRNPHSRQESLQKLINARLPCLVPYPLYTPNHPPYAQMIIIALQELNKKMGSSKVSISRFIKSMHEDLPLAHEHLLTHHLERLVEVGEIISVKKKHTLYTLPTAYSTNSNKQQEGEQLRMAGGETVRGEMSSYGVDEGPVHQPKKRPVTLIEPVPQPKKHPVTLIEPESVGGDDGGTKHQDVVTESVDFLQNKLTTRGRDRPPKERSSLYTNDGLVVQPKKRPMTLVEPELMGGDDSGTKHTEVPTDPVDSLPNKLTVRARQKFPKENSKVKQHQITLVRCSERLQSKAVVLYAEANDDDPESTGGDDSGMKHTEVPTEPVDSLPNKLTVRGRQKSPKENSKVEQHQNTIVRGSERLQSKAVVVCAVANDDNPELMGGDDSGTKHTEVLTEPVDSLPNKLTVRGLQKSPKENSKVEQHQTTLVRSSERLQSKAVVYAVANDDNPTVGYHSPVPQSRGRGRPGKKKFKIKHIQQVGSKNFATQDDNEGPLILFENQPTTLVEMVKPLQMKLPVRGRGRPSKRKSEVKPHRQEAEKISDAIPSVAAADNEDQPQEERELALIATADNNIAPLEMSVSGETEKESE